VVGTNKHDARETVAALLADAADGLARTHGTGRRPGRRARRRGGRRCCSTTGGRSTPPRSRSAATQGRARTTLHEREALLAAVRAAAVSRRRPTGSGSPVGVVRPAVEGALLDQLEIEAHAVGEEPLAAADHARRDEEVVLVHQAGRDRLRGEVRAVDGEIVIGLGLELAHRVRVEGPLDPGLLARHRLQRRGVDDLLAACQSRAYCTMCGGASGSVCAVSQKTIVSYIAGRRGTCRRRKRSPMKVCTSGPRPRCRGRPPPPRRSRRAR
jgi:hypothetical protein